MKRVHTTGAAIAAAMTTTLTLGAGSAMAAGETTDEVGVNLAPIADWSTSWTFVDLMRSARRWIPQTSQAPSGTWDTGAFIETDSNGWPSRLGADQAATTLMAREVGGDYPSGEYTVFYDGDGVLEFGWDARVTSHEQFPGGGGKMTLDVSPSEAGIVMIIRETTVGNHIRNVRVIAPGFADTYQDQVFHPEFLKSLEDFGTLRFMDWQDTNHSKADGWEDITPYGYYSQGAASHGASIELMVKLGNKLDKDMWFCIPHLADDEYVRNFAAKVAELVEPGRKVYIEHSNEIWNGGFSQYHYCSEQGQARGLGNAPWEAAWLYHSERSVQIFDIVDDYLTSDQLVRVMGSQAANWWITKLTLEHNDAWQKTDAVAIAPYFAGEAIEPGNYENARFWSVDQVVDSLERDMDVVMDWVDDHLSETTKYDVELIGYEGGQHLAPITETQRNDSNFVNLLIEANRSQRMRSIMSRYLERWHEREVGPMVLFNHISDFNKFGSWGLKETQSQPLEEAPKMAGTLDFIQSRAGTHTSAADLNADGFVDTNDITTFVTLYQQRQPEADFNGDGFYDTGDVQTFVSVYNSDQ